MWKTWRRRFINHWQARAFCRARVGAETYPNRAGVAGCRRFATSLQAVLPRGQFLFAGPRSPKLGMPYPRSVFQRSGLERPESPSLPSPFVSRHSNRLSWLPLGRRTHETPPRGLRVLRTFLSLFPSPALSRPSVLHLALPLLSSTPVGVFVLVLSVIASQSSARQRSFYLVNHTTGSF